LVPLDSIADSCRRNELSVAVQVFIRLVVCVRVVGGVEFDLARELEFVKLVAFKFVHRARRSEELGIPLP